VSDQELGLWFNGADTYVARDAEHARELMAEQTGERIDDVPNVGKWREQAATGERLSLQREGERGGEPIVTKTVAEWIADNGPGFLFSTEW